jgi:hypothetical protein
MFTKQNQIADLGKEPARRQIVTPVVNAEGDVESRIEKVPSGAFMKAVDPAGNIVRLPLHNGRANRAADDPYKLDKEHVKPRKGFIPVDRCPATLPPDIYDGQMKQWLQ